ncbi:MAG: fused MFS/spermidine synthase [Pseudomonadota bacterium]
MEKKLAASEILIFAVVLLCFLLSGFAALLYQSAWLRQFAIVFGTSELAVAAVLAAYMGGLAVGAAVAGRLVQFATRPIFIYGVLEAGIAVFALLVPVLIFLTHSGFIALFGDQPEPPDATDAFQTGFYLIVTFLVLAAPTAFMGATLPLLTRSAVKSRGQIGPRIGLLYGVNTFGAVLGALAAGFIFLPQLGLTTTVWIGVATNGMIFFFALLLAKLEKNANETVAASRESTNAAPSSFYQTCVAPVVKNWRKPISEFRKSARRAEWIYPLMLVSGSVAFTYEILWTRLLAHVLGGATYAFATMLASFLAGIAIGGGVAGLFARSTERATTLFVAAQMGVALASLAAYSWIVAYPPMERGLAQNALLAFFVMTPSTIFIGATFPLAVRIGSANAEQSASVSGRIFSWNTCGAILGAIAAAFYILPTLEFAGTIQLAFVLNILIALLAVNFLTASRRVWIAAGLTVVVVSLIIVQPTEPRTLVASSAIIGASDDNGTPSNETIYYEVGRSTTVHVSENNGLFDIRTNGLPEAQVRSKGSPLQRNTQKWLGALPFTARPDARAALMIGYGGGVAIEGIPPTVEDIDVIELEGAVIRANEIIGDWRNKDPLNDPSVRITINDARNALMLTKKTYDVIISQPSHPWTAGASHLYTKEFISIARARLNHGGVYLQWINSTFVTEPLLMSMAATIADQFRYVRLYQPDPTVLFFLASDSPLNEIANFEDFAAQNEAYRRHFTLLGIPATEDLIAALSASENGIAQMAAEGFVSTDDKNVMAYQSRPLADGIDASQLSELLTRFDPLLNMDAQTQAKNWEKFNIVYLVNRLISTGFERRALALGATLEAGSQQEFVRAVGLRFHGRTEQSDEALVKAIVSDPNDQQILYAYVQPYLGALAAGRAPAYIAAAADRLGTPARAVLDGWRYGYLGEWDALEALDSELARVSPTDLWFPQAVKLRLDWRLKLAATSGDEALAREALLLADELLPVHASIDIHVLRGGAALILGDDLAFAESVRSVSNIVDAKLERAAHNAYLFTDDEIARTKQRLIGMSNELENSSARSSREVYERARDVTERLETIGQAG